MIWFMYLMLACMFLFLLWVKKRLDRGEPLFGWRRKQYLAETLMDNREGGYNKQSTQELIGIKDIKYGIVEKDRNEYAIVLATDYVNYDLLSDQGKKSTLAGYEQLFKVISFPLQITIQAVRQDSRKDILRFRRQSAVYGNGVNQYADGVIRYIQNITWEESRIVKRVYYIIGYRYEPSQNAQIRADDKLYRVIQELNTRAMQVKNMLKRGTNPIHCIGKPGCD